MEENVYKINNPVRLIELFAGVGSQAMALERLQINFEHYRVVEFDKFAIKTYNQIHDTNFPVIDITNLSGKDLGIYDTSNYCYIMTYSFPCQDLSKIGDRAGMGRGKNTRSGLLWEVERLLSECNELPQVLVMENVVQVHGNKNMRDFEEWCNLLREKGYMNYWQDINAKDFGIPQNRNRCFMISIRDKKKYFFPEKIPLHLHFKDLFENNIEKKYYLSSKLLNYFKRNDEEQRSKGNGFRFLPTTGEGLGYSITSRPGAGRMTDNYIIDSLGCRKLTPKECWRMMDFLDKDFEKARQITSDTQLYKQAGNSIVVNCLVAILGQLFEGKENIYKQDKMKERK